MLLGEGFARAISGPCPRHVSSFIFEAKSVAVGSQASTQGWGGGNHDTARYDFSFNLVICLSPPARWGLLDFISVACSSSSFSSSFSSSSPRLLSSSPLLSSPPPPPAQPRSTLSVPCRTSTTTIHAQCALPDLNHDHPRPVFPAGPQPRVSPPSVPCRTSTTTIHAQCSLPDLNREYPRQVFPAGPHVGRYGTKNVQKKVRKNVRKNVRRYARRYAR